MTEYIYYIRHCLKYEARPDVVGTCHRTAWDRKKKSDKDAYFKRITPQRAAVEQDRIESEEFRTQYDRAIMQKYNVGPDYRQNRYFMEQVRPTLY